MTNVFFSNVVMCNYFIALLATVYEEGSEQGDFAFKCNKY